MEYQYQSPWFVEALQKEDNLEVNQLDLNLDTDICIIGGGFTGLWAALKIKEKKPSTNIILIEKDLCGSGASGRNGGCMIPQSTKFQGIEKVVGTEDAKKIVSITDSIFIEKIRYIMYYESMKWEIDEFLGNNKGLLIAEVELEDENQKIKLPDWIVKEVTNQNKYFNYNLALRPYISWKH